MFTHVPSECVREIPLFSIPESSITGSRCRQQMDFTRAPLHIVPLTVLVDLTCWHPISTVSRFCEPITYKVMSSGCSLHGFCFEQLWAFLHRCHLGKCGVTWYFLNILLLFITLSNIHMSFLYLSFFISTYNKFLLKIVNLAQPISLCICL